METVRNAETRPRDACSSDVDRGIPDMSPSLGACALGVALFIVPALLAWSAFHYAQASGAVENCKASPGAVE